MRRIRSGCCARAASGDAAAPPSNAMNWRRCMCPARTAHNGDQLQRTGGSEDADLSVKSGQPRTTANIVVAEGVSSQSRILSHNINLLLIHLITYPQMYPQLGTGF